MPKNPCGKTRDKNRPYELWRNSQGWEWRVLKKYQLDDAKPYASWFCFVTSPFCPEGEYGDTYVTDVTGNARKVWSDGEAQAA